MIVTVTERPAGALAVTICFFSAPKTGHFRGWIDFPNDFTGK